MKMPDICNHLRSTLKHPALAVAVAAGLAAGSVQALTVSATYDLGASPAATTIQPGVAGLLPWIAKGSLPGGSILKSVSVDAKLETATTDDWALDLNVYLDPSPEAAGTAALLQVGGYGTIGTVSLALTEINSTGWANGAGGPPTTVIDTKTEADWAAIGAVDLSTVEVSVGNDYSEAAWSGTITVVYEVFEPATITSFGPGAAVGALVGTAADIAWTLPSGTDVTALAPTFTLSSGTCDRDNGGPTTYDFTNPVLYTVTDGDDVNTYTVTVTLANSVLWDLAGGGAWDLATHNWLTQPGGLSTTFANGNQVIFDNTAGGTITIDPGISPLSTTVSATSGTYTFSGEPIGSGSLTKDGGGTLQLNVTPANFSSITVTGGTLYLFAAESGFAPNAAPFTMPDTTVETGAAVQGYRAHATGGTLTLNGGRYWEYNGWNDGGWWGPVYLATDSYFGNKDGWCYAQTIGGEISGPGGFTYDSYGNQQNAPLTLAVANSYTGPTIVNSGQVVCKDPASLGNGGALTIKAGAKVNLDYTGEHNVAALTLGGVAQPGGTHGSTASDATFTSDTYFAGTGMVTVPASSEKNILTFSFGALGAATIGDTTITLEVPFGTDRTNLAPTYTVSAEASGSPLSGTALDFTGPQTYTVTAQDLSTKDYTVTVTEAILPDIFTWATAASGDWGVSTNWTNEESIDTAPLAGGRESYTLNFDAAGTYTATNNLATGFELNQLNFSSAVTLAGNGLAFVANDATLPTINQDSSSTVTISNDLELGSDTTFGGLGNGQVNFTGVVSGAGSLTKDGSGELTINKPLIGSHSFSGGTIINSGQLRMNLEATLGTGPITLNGGTIFMWRFHPLNALTVNGGTLLSENGFGNSWNGPITLNADLNCDVYYPLNITGNISGTGGLTKNIGIYNPILTLSGTNNYTGPTSVTAGTLQCNSPDSLGGGDLSINGGTLNLNYDGTKTVASLTLGGVAQTVDGTYGSLASGANFPDDTYFAGSGKVRLGGNDFASWLGGFTLTDTSFNGDDDRDKLGNGIEGFFGSDPSVANAGLTEVGYDDSGLNTVVTFQHPNPDEALADVTGDYEWSLDLGTWNASGATAGGTTVTISASPNDPVDNITTVTATITDTVPAKVFVRAVATQTM